VRRSSHRHGVRGGHPPRAQRAHLAGGILAFGLSFDELIVTTFTAGHEQTLPIWLLNQLEDVSGSSR